MLVIIYSNNHPTQCYPRIRLRNPSNCDDLMINPAVTDANTSITETHYDRLAAVAQHQGLDFTIMMPHIEFLSRINGQHITHLYMEAGPKYLDHPKLQQQHSNLVLSMFESGLKQSMFSVIFTYCTNLETLTLRNFYMSSDVEVPKNKNHPLRRLEIQNGAFSPLDIDATRTIIPLGFLSSLQQLVMTDFECVGVNYINLPNSVLDNFTWKITKKETFNSPKKKKVIISICGFTTASGEHRYYMMDEDGSVPSTQAHIKRLVPGLREFSSYIHLGIHCEFIRSFTIIFPSFEKTYLVHPF